MKPISRSLLLCLVPFALLHAQEAETPAKAPLPHEQAFSNLPEEKRKEFADKLAEAQRLFAGKRVFEALEKVNEAQTIFPDNPDLLNLRGACEVEFRSFDKAMESFKKADQLTPDKPLVVFNIGELEFVTKKWEDAEETFTKVLKLIGDNPQRQDLQLARLVEFKLLLCKVKLGKDSEVAELAKKYDYLDDSPFPYYAEAVMHFTQGREVEAESAMARGGRIFQDPGYLAPWQDTMIEFGYIKGFFGGDHDAAASGGQ